MNHKRIYIVVLAFILFVGVSSLMTSATRRKNAAPKRQTQSAVALVPSPVPVSSIRLVKTEAAPALGSDYTEATYQNISTKEIVYIVLNKGNPPYSERIVLNYANSDNLLGPQEEATARVQHYSEYRITAVVFADGTAEGELPAVREATFELRQVRRAAQAVVARAQAAEARRIDDVGLGAELLAAADELDNQPHRTAGAFSLAAHLRAHMQHEGASAARPEIERLRRLLAHTQDGPIY